MQGRCCVCVQRRAKKLACLMTCISGCMYVQARGWVHTCFHDSPLYSVGFLRVSLIFVKKSFHHNAQVPPPKPYTYRPYDTIHNVKGRVAKPDARHHTGHGHATWKCHVGMDRTSDGRGERAGTTTRLLLGQSESSVESVRERRAINTSENAFS